MCHMTKSQLYISKSGRLLRPDLDIVLLTLYVKKYNCSIPRDLTCDLNLKYRGAPDSGFRYPAGYHEYENITFHLCLSIENLQSQSPGPKTSKHLILTFDLTVTKCSHVTSILSTLRCFGCVLWRAFECRLAPTLYDQQFAR